MSTLVAKLHNVSAPHVEDRVAFGTALDRFSQPDPVRTTPAVRALAARVLAARVERKEISAEEWAERFMQNTNDA